MYSVKKRSNNYVTDYRGDGPVIILLHGFVSSSHYWKKLQPRLSQKGYRVVTIDLLGFGNAPKPANSDYSYSEHIAHINRAIGKLDIKDPFILMGHSLGALLAARYCRLHSHRIKSLVLLHAPIYKDKNQVRETLRSTGRFYKMLLDSQFRKYIWIVLRNFGPIGKHNSHSRESTLTNVIEKAEILDDLKNIHIPTLLLVGTRDRKEYIANLLNHRSKPNVSIVIEDTGHHSPRLHPDLVLKYLSDFLSASK